ncbi:MAG: LarC family nickel insertion protein [Bdellovibrionota bacterium]
MKTLYLESVAGVAGDMFAASFVDAGLVSAEELQKLPALLGLEDVEVRISKVVKASIQCTHIDVGWKSEKWKKVLGESHAHAQAHGNVLNPNAPDASHWHTHYAWLDRFLEESKLNSFTKSFARKVFRHLAQAEAEAHGMKIEDVAFHEVGAVDSIVDVVMAAFCVGKVDPEKIFASPVKLGRGLVKMEHGTHPVPPPASARLSIGFPVTQVPAAIARENVELSTPTGLAILRSLAPEWHVGVPAGVVQAQGMGAGTMDLGSYPNVFRVMVLDAAQEAYSAQGTRAKGDAKPGSIASGLTPNEALPFEKDQVIEVTCNMDDETAERTAWVMEHLMEMGALDVWATPVTGKKGRVAVCLSILAKVDEWARFADWLLRHSSTFGVRYHVWDRLKLSRRIESRKTPQGEVRVKVGFTTSGEVLKEKPEFEDLRKLWEKDPGFHRHGS